MRRMPDMLISATVEAKAGKTGARWRECSKEDQVFRVSAGKREDPHFKTPRHSSMLRKPVLGKWRQKDPGA